MKDRGSNRRLIIQASLKLWDKSKRKGLVKPTGIVGRKGCFNAFFDRMGGQEDVKVRNGNDEIFSDVRCDLAHSCLIGVDMIDMNSGLTCGIENDDHTRDYAFHARTYFDHFKLGVSSYPQGLMKGQRIYLLWNRHSEISRN